MPSPISSGAADIRQLSITLTDAEVKTLPTASVELIPTPGTNRFILVFFAHAHLEWIADYTNIDAASLINLTIGTSETVWPLRQSIGSGVSALLAGGGPDGTHAFFSPRFAAGAAHSDSFSATSNLYDADIVNLPLTISLNNGGAGNLTGGDAGNALKVTLLYTIIDI